MVSSGKEKLKDKLKLTHNAKVFIIIGGLFTVANGLSGTFVNVYLWKANNDFVKIGLFNFFHYLLIPITFIAGGWLAKKKNGTTSLRIGIVFHAIFYLLILSLGPLAARYVILLGVLLGIAAGFYWVASHTLSFDLTSRFNRDTFNSFNGMVGSLSGMFTPMIAGYTIVAFTNTTGYRIIFGISLAIFVVIVLVSLMFKIKTEDNAFHLLGTYRESTQSWKYIMLGQSFFGVRNGVLMFLINLLVYITTKSEASIGKLALLGSLIAVPTFIVLERILKPKYRTPLFTTGAVMMFVSVLILVLKINFTTLLLFTIINTMFVPLFSVPFNSAAFNTIEKNHQEGRRIEYIILQEIALNFGRLIGTLAFIFVVKTWKDPEVIRIFLLLVGSMQIWILSFRKKLDFDERVMDEA